MHSCWRRPWPSCPRRRSHAYGDVGRVPDVDRRGELGDANRVTELLELNAELLGDPDVILPGWELALPEGARASVRNRPRRRARRRPRRLRPRCLQPQPQPQPACDRAPGPQPSAGASSVGWCPHRQRTRCHPPVRVRRRLQRGVGQREVPGRLPVRPSDMGLGGWQWRSGGGVGRRAGPAGPGPPTAAGIVSLALLRLSRERGRVSPSSGTRPRVAHAEGRPPRGAMARRSPSSHSSACRHDASAFRRRASPW